MEGDNSISVSVRVRPLTSRESASLHVESAPDSLFQTGASLSAGSSNLTSHRAAGSGLRRILQVVDDRVLVFDPDSPLLARQKALLPQYKKIKDLRFCFDRVYDESATQDEVYEGSASNLLEAAFAGYNATVFAYGATGCGKTHTISGTPEDPGVVYRLMQSVFDRIEATKEQTHVELTVSYLEIYNETIKDLMVDAAHSKPLMLRESEHRVVVPGLTEHTPRSAGEVLELIRQGNLKRTTNFTEANATSSRSHAVLSVNLKMKPRTADISESYSLSTLSVIDLAGSERARVTNNKGARLHEGANINKSLLALGNCINALCDPKQRGHVPFRNSKLTRLLKHSLTGNCRTQLIVCVSPSSGHYDETYNTLQYANRAKDIKTKVTRNVISVDRHVSQYVKVIYELRQELDARKKDDSTREAKARTEDRRARDFALADVSTSIQRLSASKDDFSSRIYRSGQAKGGLDALSRLSRAFSSWHDSLHQVSTEAPPELAQQALQETSALSSELRGHLPNLQSQASDTDSARRLFDSNISVARQRIQHPDGLMVFDCQIRTLNLELDLAEARGREEGRIAVSGLQVKAFTSISNALAQLAVAAPALVHAAQSFFAAIGAGLANKQTALSALPPHQVNTRPSFQPATIVQAPGHAQDQSDPPSPKRKKKTVLWKDEAGDGMDLEEPESSSTVRSQTPVISSLQPAPAPLQPTQTPVAPVYAPRLTASQTHVTQPARRLHKTSSRMKLGTLGSSGLDTIPDEQQPSSQTSSPFTVNPPSASSSSAADTSTTSGIHDISNASINTSMDRSGVHQTRSSLLKAAHGRRKSSLSQNLRRSSIGPVKGLRKPSQAPRAPQPPTGEGTVPQAGASSSSTGPSPAPRLRPSSSFTPRGPGRASLAQTRGRTTSGPSSTTWK